MPSVDLQNEVRFAVVLYGGVSLAIYINGVTQELLRMVRATAPNPGDETHPRHAATESTESVYRKIGQILAQPWNPATKSYDLPPDWQDALPIRTQFVVDVISGTSAGGINGVFLAKALALDRDLNELQQLWIKEGDIQALLNDDGSAVQNLPPKSPPTSLLNSQRMYWKLYEAMARMDSRTADPSPVSPYVEELDLFVTATDLNGQLLPLPALDKQVFERRHRAIFHFRYADADVAPEPQNQFTKAYTPLLAFAARCTSSFPVAFEPVELDDAIDILQRTGALTKQDAEQAASRWKEIAAGYANHTGPMSLDFPQRPFADGGYLDNKPFSYAIDEIRKRNASLPVERKLIYIEPAPDQPEKIKELGLRPDAIDNALAALSDLPRYETIRGDLETVYNHNNEVRRIRGLVKSIEAVVAQYNQQVSPRGTTNWVAMDTLALLRRYGQGYLTYHRLKISAVTDDLTALLRRHFGVESGSAYEQAIRLMVVLWRSDHYGPQSHAATSVGKTDQWNQFLSAFDVNYRIRRIRHIRRMLHEALSIDPGPDRTSHFERLNDGVSIVGHPDFSAELCQISAALLQPHLVLRKLGATRQDLEDLGALNHLQEVLRNDPSEASARRAYAGNNMLFSAAAAKLRLKYRAAFDVASAAILTALDPATAPNAIARLAREYLRGLYDNFEDYDSVTFPVLHDSGVADLSFIDVARISPLDATNLVNEDQGQDRKLKGAALGAFGAFLDREWRRNDILWGRLDGAERLISVLLPKDDALRRQLIDEAHCIILRDFGLQPIANIDDARKRLDEHRHAIRSEPERNLAARSLARATSIIGRMLQQISRDRQWDGRPFATLTRAGGLLWGMVEVATPRSLQELLFQHFVKLAYFFEFALILAGFFVDGLQLTGLKLFAWTFAIHLAVLTLRDYLCESRRVLYALGVVFGLAVFVVTLTGVMEILNLVQTGRTLADVRLPELAPNLNWVSRITGVMGALAILVGWWMERRGKRLKYPVNERPAAPMLHLEFARSAADVRRIAGESWHVNRRVFRAMQEADSWFIFAYTLVFAGLGVLAWLAGWKWTGAATILTGLLAGAFDFWENRGINTVLGNPLAELTVNDKFVVNIAGPATAKWALIFATLAFQAVVLLGRGFAAQGSLWPKLLGLSAAAAALAGLLGLVVDTQSRRCLAAAVACMVFTLLLITILLLFAPSTLLG